MSEVPKSSDAAQTSGDTTNPFAPIDYTSRLKAPVRHTGTFHAMQPLQPGQLYGTAHRMTPPKPLPSFPASQESGAPSAEQNPPVFSAPLPSYMNSSPVDPAPQSAPAASDLPPYLQRRPPIGRATVQAQPSEEAKVALYSAADVQEPSPASGAQPEAQAPAAQARASTHPRPAGSPVISWKRHRPRQMTRALPRPLRLPCRPCRKCRPDFPSSPPGMAPPRRRPRCSLREANPERPMRRRFSPAPLTGPARRMMPAPLVRNLRPSPWTR